MKTTTALMLVVAPLFACGGDDSASQPEELTLWRAMDDGTGDYIDIACPESYYAISGGCVCLGPNGVLWSSAPAPEGEGWACGCLYQEPTDTIVVLITCAPESAVEFE